MAISTGDSIKIKELIHCPRNMQQYTNQYQDSIDDNEAYWSIQASRLDWVKPFTRVKDVSFAKDDLHIRWFDDGELNICVNCVDRHLAEKANKTAIIWEGNDASNTQHISYKMLHQEVCKLANGLISLGLEAGDRVILYMPMIPEAVYSMLACARLGIIHSVVFGGFSANALADRIDDCEAKLVITADEGARGDKFIPLKTTVDEALAQSSKNTAQHVLMAKVSGNNVAFKSGRDIHYNEFVSHQSDHHEAQAFNAEHPLFILYTSGSTGKPKGLQHSSGGYLTYVSSTFKKYFDHKDDDIHWCTADIGWITGHSYTVYGPLAEGATTLMFEGVPSYPNMGRIGEVIDKHHVSLFYTAPTAIRALQAQSDIALDSSKRSSLRLLATAGEPINPEAWNWYFSQFGESHCEVIDTWWQTETGGIMISPPPVPMQHKPGAAMTPAYGIQPALVDKEGNVLSQKGEVEGHLVILDSWPSQARTIWGDHQRFYETYFSTHEGMYFSGDGAKRDKEGHYWITGRVDDVLNVSGHRLGTAEVECAVVANEKVAEAAVVGYPSPIKGEGIYIYAIAAKGVKVDNKLTDEIIKWVRGQLGPVATPDLIQWVPGLPKTRSGKVMRRILRKIAADDFDSLGDISTLAEPEVVDTLISGRLNK